eukprot:6181693-Pleurochrysis_carterae.AAC.2
MRVVDCFSDESLPSSTARRQEDLALLAEAPRASLEYKLAALRYAERRAAEASQRAFKGRLAELSSLEYYQARANTYPSHARQGFHSPASDVNSSPVG